MDSSQITNARDGERGIAFVYLAFILIPILCFFALALDSMHLAGAHARVNHFARLASLAAVEAYFDQTVGSEATKLANSYTRAQEILDNNKILLSSGTGYSSLSTVQPADGSAWIEPGNFTFVQSGGIPCFSGPCLTAGNLGPCYTADCFLGRTADPAVSVNAFRVRGNLYSDLNQILSQFITSNRPSTPVFSVATVIPRHTCFLVDVSPTVVYETHNRDRNFCGPNSQDTAPLNGYSNYAAFWLPIDNPVGTPETRMVSDWNFLAGTLAGDTCTGNPYDRGTGHGPCLSCGTSEKVHYPSDYVKRIQPIDNDKAVSGSFFADHPDPNELCVDGNPCFTVGNVRQYYRVDTFRDPTHVGPQPLSSILAGVRAGIQAFRDRRVAGDRACLILFDSDGFPWYRTVKLTGDFNHLLALLDTTQLGPVLGADGTPAGSVDFRAYQGMELQSRLGFFPQKGRDTDFVFAINQAIKFLADAQLPSVRSTDSIVLFSDGRANCASAPPNPPQRCGEAYGYFNAAWNEILSTSRTAAGVAVGLLARLQDANIAVHTFPIGAISGPHHVEVARSAIDNTCLSEGDARKNSMRFTAAGRGGMGDGTTGDIVPYTTGSDPVDMYIAKDPNDPFFESVDNMDRLAVGTRGLYSPLRPSGPGCVPLADNRTCTTTPKRYFKDPKCRAIQQQVTDSLNALLRINPYSVVQVKPL